MGIYISTDARAVLLCSVFFFAFVMLTYLPNQTDFLLKPPGADGAFHFHKAREECQFTDYPQGCTDYPPLLSIISAPFAGRWTFFMQFISFIIVFLTPLLLYRITGRVDVIWFYFATTQYAYFILGGTFAQGLVGVLVLAVLAMKNLWAKVAIVLVSIIAHSLALPFVLLAVLATTITITKKNAKFLSFFSFPPDLNFNWTTAPFLSVIIRIIPPYYLFAVKELFKRERYDLLLLAVVCVICAFLPLGIFPRGQHRIIFFAPLFLLPGLSWYCEKGRYRYYIYLLSGVWFIFEIQQWLQGI